MDPGDSACPDDRADAAPRGEVRPLHKDQLRVPADGAPQAQDQSRQPAIDRAVDRDLPGADQSRAVTPADCASHGECVLSDRPSQPLPDDWPSALPIDEADQEWPLDQQPAQADDALSRAAWQLKIVETEAAIARFESDKAKARGEVELQHQQIAKGQQALSQQQRIDSQELTKREGEIREQGLRLELLQVEAANANRKAELELERSHAENEKLTTEVHQLEDARRQAAERERRSAIFDWITIGLIVVVLAALIAGQIANWPWTGWAAGVSAVFGLLIQVLSIGRRGSSG